MPEIKQSYYLQQALNFTDADLKANRAGQLSKQQVKNLRKYQRVNIPVISIALLALGFLILWFLGMLASTYIPWFVRVFFVIMFLPVVIMLAKNIHIVHLNIFGLNSDIATGEVKQGTGILKEVSSVIPSPEFYIRLGNNTPRLSVAINNREFYRLEENAVYTVYYLPRTGRVVAMEKADREMAIRELKDELKYLDAQQASLKSKKKKF